MHMSATVCHGVEQCRIASAWPFTHSRNVCALHIPLTSSFPLLYTMNAITDPSFVLSDINASFLNTIRNPGPEVEVYILLGLYVQPQLQKVQPKCMRVQPQLGRAQFVGRRVSAVSLGGQSFDLKGPSVGLRRLEMTRKALCRPERAFVGLTGPFSV